MPGGSPPHEPTQETRIQVTAYAILRISTEKIAKLIGISRPTLRKHYKLELELAPEIGSGTAVNTLLNKMGQGSVRAVEVYLNRFDSRAGDDEAMRFIWSTDHPDRVDADDSDDSDVYTEPNA